MDIPKLIEQYEKRKKYAREYAKRTGYKQVKNWMARNPASRLYGSAKQVAKRYDLEFTITKEDINIPEICPYLGIKLTNIQGMGRLPYNMALSRIDLSKGYTPDNIEVISNMASLVKNKGWISKDKVGKTTLDVFKTNYKAIHGTEFDNITLPSEVLNTNDANTGPTMNEDEFNELWAYLNSKHGTEVK